MSVKFGPVFPIIPSYTATGDLDLDRTAAYARHLHENGATAAMTTAGTSQFNLLSTQEVAALNSTVAGAFPGRLILGVPSLSEPLLFPFLTEMTNLCPRAALLLNYPERLYKTAEVIGFFDRVGRAFRSARLYLHGLPLRPPGGSGAKDYTGQMISAIAATTPQFSGMKEECSTYEAGFSLCATLAARVDFELIVAGGSMRRFLLLQAAGAQSFLAGVGSLFPNVEVSFHDHMMNGRLREAGSIIAQVETPVFDVFMSVGWHKALRHAAKRLKLIGNGERLPMTGLDEADAHRVDAALGLAQERIETLRRERTL